MARVTATEYQEMLGTSAAWSSDTVWTAAIATVIIAAAAGYIIKANENVTAGIGGAIGATLFGIIFGATAAAASGLPNDGILHGLLAAIPGLMVGGLSAMFAGGLRDHRDRKRDLRQEQKYKEENNWPPLRPR